MTSDLDTALHRLSAEPVHAGLLTIEADVLARVNLSRRQAGRGVGIPFAVVAAVGAVTLGFFGAGQPAPVNAATLSPFGPSTPLAPSTLLASAS